MLGFLRTGDLFKPPPRPAAAMAIAIAIAMARFSHQFQLVIKRLTNCSQSTLAGLQSRFQPLGPMAEAIKKSPAESGYPGIRVTFILQLKLEAENWRLNDSVNLPNESVPDASGAVQLSWNNFLFARYASDI